MLEPPRWGRMGGPGLTLSRTLCCFCPAPSLFSAPSGKPKLGSHSAASALDTVHSHPWRLILPTASCPLPLLSSL